LYLDEKVVTPNPDCPDSVPPFFAPGACLIEFEAREKVLGVFLPANESVPKKEKCGRKKFPAATF
jgi:hypothetical protein